MRRDPDFVPYQGFAGGLIEGGAPPVSNAVPPVGDIIGRPCGTGFLFADRHGHLAQLAHATESPEMPCAGANIDRFLLGMLAQGIICQQGGKTLGLRLQDLSPSFAFLFLSRYRIRQQFFAFLLAGFAFQLRPGDPLGPVSAADGQQDLNENRPRGRERPRRKMSSPGSPAPHRPHIGSDRWRRSCRRCPPSHPAGGPPRRNPCRNGCW